MAKRFLLAMLCILAAFPSFLLASEEIPGPLRQALERAQNLMEANAFQEAEQVLQKFRQGSPLQHYLLDYMQASALLSSGRTRQARDLFLAATDKNTGFAPAHRGLGQCSYELGDMALAGREFEKAYYLLEKKEPELLFYAASAFSQAGEHGKAIGLFDLLMNGRMEKASLEWREGMAQALLAAGKAEKALPLLENLARESQGARQKQWQEALLYQYVRQGEKQKALELAAALIDADPASPDGWKTLWRLHMAQGDQVQALSVLIAYGFCFPLTSEELALAGDLASACGIPGSAVDFYAQALEKRMEPLTLEKLASASMRADAPQKALEWIEKAGRQGMGRELLLTRGYLFYDMRQYTEAAAVFEEAAGFVPEPGRAWLMAGYAAINAGQPDRARTFIKKAEQYDHSAKAAKNLLNQLQPQEEP